MAQSLYQKLQACRSEEDVKDEYIKALGLKGVSRNLIDIQTKEIWFEAKDGTRESIYAMYTQLLHYPFFRICNHERSKDETCQVLMW